MTQTPAEAEIDARARQRLAADEARADKRRSISLSAAWTEFWKHPSPWMMLTTLVGASSARLLGARFHWTELVVPGAFLLFFPVIEWVVHVVVLHWRPVRVAGIRIDPLVSRKHREHHADPRDLPLVFIPWQVMGWLIAGTVAIGLLAFPSRAAGLSFVVGITLIAFAYEWMHYLIHSDYRPKSRLYRSVWRDHRLHHYKNEHYWFTVTTSGTADRLFGTYPDPGTVAKSPTARQLHNQDVEKPLAG